MREKPYIHSSKPSTKVCCEEVFYIHYWIFKIIRLAAIQQNYFKIEMLCKSRTRQKYSFISGNILIMLATDKALQNWKIFLKALSKQLRKLNNYGD